MTTEMKEKIRPIYSELQGYLSQAPSGKTSSIHHEECWNLYNQTLDELQKATNRDYKKFHISPVKGMGEIDFIDVGVYRQKLGGLISRLHGEYFSDEIPPFSGMPSTVITQNQQQVQSVQMFLDIQSKIIESSRQFDEGSKERKFIDKLKGSLSTVSNVTDMIKLCMKLAEEFGIGIAALLKIFS
jgi:hypothetical protein